MPGYVYLLKSSASLQCSFGIKVNLREDLDAKSGTADLLSFCGELLDTPAGLSMVFEHMCALVFQMPK